MTDSTSLPPPGWYDDTLSEGVERFWDGAAWTDDVRPRVMPPPAPAPPPPPTLSLKSSATATLVVGVASLLPGWGLILGPVGWWLGNREIREIDSGLRVRAGRNKAAAGRGLSIAGTAISVLISIYFAVAGVPRISSPPPEWFAENGVAFVYPDDWREMEVDAPPDPVWQFVVTPDRSSGNYISFRYLPASVTGSSGAAEEAYLMNLSEADADGSIRIVQGPDEIEISGLRGLAASLEGIIGERTGQELSAETVALFSGGASYMLTAQYEAGSRDIVLLGTAPGKAEQANSEWRDG